MEESDEIRVKNEPICDSQSIPETREAKIQSNKVKKEPIDNEIETSKTHIEVKTEEKFSSSREEVFSIGFLNEETNGNKLEKNQTTTNNIQTNKPDSNISIDKQRYKCDYCEKRFSKSSDLVNHRRVHTGEKPFECDVCEKRFSLSSNLEVHLRIHIGYKPFECDVCEKRFNVLSNLKVHKRIHSGDKPFECDVCQKRFTQSVNLASHKRVHTGEKPFECDVCKKSFHTKCGLIYHSKTHTLQ